MKPDNKIYKYKMTEEDREHVETLKQAAQKWYDTGVEHYIATSSKILFLLLSVVCNDQYERDKKAIEQELNDLFDRLGAPTPKPKGEA